MKTLEQLHKTAPTIRALIVCALSYGPGYKAEDIARLLNFGVSDVFDYLTYGKKTFSPEECEFVRENILL